MRESIGSVFLYNIIIIFIFLVFAFLAAIMSYSKAFKVNSRIVATIEKYEGYNELAKDEIDQILYSIGYRYEVNKISKDDCPATQEGRPVMDKGKLNYFYCVYYFPPEVVGRNHYRYGVISYMQFDFSFIGVVFRIPVYTKTNSMYNYSF